LIAKQQCSSKERSEAFWSCVLVERVVRNALGEDTAALPPIICAFGGSFGIAFGEVDPP
jgi:hypothetical protein